MVAGQLLDLDELDPREDEEPSPAFGAGTPWRSPGAGGEQDGGDFALLLERLKEEHQNVLLRATSALKQQNAVLASKLRRLRRSEGGPSPELAPIAIPDDDEVSSLKSGTDGEASPTRPTPCRPAVEEEASPPGQVSEEAPSTEAACQQVERPQRFRAVSEVTRPSSTGSSPRGVVRAELLPTWATVRDKHRSSVGSKSSFVSRLSYASQGSLLSEIACSESTISDVGRNCCAWLARKVVLGPSSIAYRCWTALGFLFILYDIILIPLGVFDLPDNSFLDAMPWIRTVFWTFDVGGHFFVGYQSRGHIEMRLRDTALHYARGWFSFDACVTTVDWLTLLLVVDPGRVGHSQPLRLLQLLRLLRLAKVQGVVRDIRKSIRSEATLIRTGILGNLLVIMVLNHVIACAWYLLGSEGHGEGGGKDTWVRANGLRARPVGYRYATALHWSLTQFTPASMEVVPKNTHERIFSVCVLVFAMVTFSSFVSSITAAMSQLRVLNKERIHDVSMLRQYLTEKRVSVDLSVRIWGVARTAMDDSRRHLHEEDVRVLASLPSSLRAELREEVCLPMLRCHPLFGEYFAMAKSDMRRLCLRALGEVALGRGQELFHAGEGAARMFFVSKGRMLYSREAPEADERNCLMKVWPAQWVAEPVLWIRWKHAGALSARTHCELIALDATKTLEVIKRIQPSFRYALCFVSFFQRNPSMLSDVWIDTSVVSDMVDRTFSSEPNDSLLAYGSYASMRRSQSGRRSWLTAVGSLQSVASLRRGVSTASRESSDVPTWRRWFNIVLP